MVQVPTKPGATRGRREQTHAHSIEDRMNMRAGGSVMRTDVYRRMSKGKVGVYSHSSPRLAEAIDALPPECWFG